MRAVLLVYDDPPHIIICDFARIFIRFSIFPYMRIIRVYLQNYYIGVLLYADKPISAKKMLRAQHVYIFISSCTPQGVILVPMMCGKMKLKGLKGINGKRMKRSSKEIACMNLTFFYVPRTSIIMIN